MCEPLIADNMRAAVVFVRWIGRPTNEQATALRGRFPFLRHQVSELMRMGYEGAAFELGRYSPSEIHAMAPELAILGLIVEGQ